MGLISTSKSSSGIDPLSMEDLHRMYSGLLNCLLHFLSSIAGTPSGPGAEFSLISAQAFSMSDILKLMSFKQFAESELLKWASKLFTCHCCLGVENTLLY